MAVAGDCIYIHGGRNNFVCDDLWVVSMGTLLWSEVKTTGRQPAPRHNHIITVTKNCLFVYGGTDELGGSRCDRAQARNKRLGRRLGRWGGGLPVCRVEGTSSG